MHGSSRKLCIYYSLIYANYFGEWIPKMVCRSLTLLRQYLTRLMILAQGKRLIFPVLKQSIMVFVCAVCWLYLEGTYTARLFYLDFHGPILWKCKISHYLMIRFMILSLTLFLLLHLLLSLPFHWSLCSIL